MAEGKKNKLYCIQIPIELYSQAENCSKQNHDGKVAPFVREAIREMIKKCLN